jgi:3-hydroxymyristoyl/3-hydroxydecanoyl-(acyl carrier protein) dehydratase
VILEALAQSAGILCFVTGRASIPTNDDSFISAAASTRRVFSRRVIPGDQLLLKVNTRAQDTGRSGNFSAWQRVAGEEACSAEMMVMPG